MFINSPSPTIGRLFSDAVNDLNAIENAGAVLAEIPYAYSGVSKKDRVHGVNECAFKELPFIFYTEFTQKDGQDYRTILRVLPKGMPSNLVETKLVKAREEAKNNDAVFYYFDSLKNSFERSK